tara:strand:+ start:314 stop:490 length:177 start_codon:yes stop_codon:yes gene_type:complete
MNNKTLRPPLCKDPTAIPTKVGMALLLVYWVAMSVMVVHGVTVKEVAQSEVQVAQKVL